MKVIFDYNKEKDIWCLLTLGKGSSFSSYQSKAHKKLIEENGENPTEEKTSIFIDKYLSEKEIDIQSYVTKYQKDWNIVSEEFTKIAEKVFKVSLPEDITAFLTVNGICPYSISNNYFFVSLPNNSMRNTAMHELWHFYTWYKFGVIWEEKLGKQKYGDLKEALSVLLNIECKDLLTEGTSDLGYPQHKEIREEIVQLWNETKDIDKVWNQLVS